MNDDSNIRLVSLKKGKCSKPELFIKAIYSRVSEVLPDKISWNELVPEGSTEPLALIPSQGENHRM